MTRLGLLFLLAGPALGSGPKLNPVEGRRRAEERVKADTLRAVYESHKKVLREIGRVMAAIVREREAFAAAGDPASRRSRNRATPAAPGILAAPIGPKKVHRYTVEFKIQAAKFPRNS